MLKNNIFNFGAGSLAQQEARLAFWMLAPTFLIVFAIVLFPVVANFWISFKSIELADLRAPQPVVTWLAQTLVVTLVAGKVATERTLNLIL